MQKIKVHYVCEYRKTGDSLCPEGLSIYTDYSNWKKINHCSEGNEAQRDCITCSLYLRKFLRCYALQLPILFLHIYFYTYEISI